MRSCLSSRAVLADFELVVWNAFHTVFGVSVYGIPLDQAVRRNYQKNGLDAAGRKDKEMWDDMLQLHSNLDPRHPMACVSRYFDRQWIHDKISAEA